MRLKDSGIQVIEANGFVFGVINNACGERDITCGERNQYNSIIFRNWLIFSISSFPFGRDTGIEKSESRI